VMCMAQMITDVVINVKVCLTCIQELLPDTTMCAAVMESMQRIKSLGLRVKNDLTSDQPVNSTVHAPLVCMSMSSKMDMWK